VTASDDRRAQPEGLNRPHSNAPSAILFDWDNTLIDGWAAIQSGLNTTFAAFGMPPWSREQVLANVRKSLRDSFPEYFGDQWERARDIFYDAVRETHLEVILPLPGTILMLDAAAHLPLGIVSNKQGPLLREEAQHLGWNARFRAVIGAGDALADKPSGLPLELCLTRMGLRAGPDIWYVGDTGVDMQAARAAGCKAVLLGDAAHDGGVAALGPDMHFSDGEALARWLGALDKGG
jgi:phosphoglycolate phosphatase